MTYQKLSDIDFPSLKKKKFHPSPVAWEDQVLYFLMLDRFSDGKEQGYLDNTGHIVQTGQTPPYNHSDYGNAVLSEDEANKWREAGTKFVGGNLQGLKSKIGYLKRLGVTAVWISPIFKQVPSLQTYHGYGIQNFLEIEPAFGKLQDLVELVEEAHRNGIYVILDIILNHAGDVFEYNLDRYQSWDQENQKPYYDPRWDNYPYPVKGFRDATGNATLPFEELSLTDYPNAWPDGAVWPKELQRKSTFTKKGRITNWDHDPEYREGDFVSLKDISHGTGDVDKYHPSEALMALCEVYKYWIAAADLDGYRIDTVKHMDKGATRYFASVIKEFAMDIGKENFYLIGEITGGRKNAFTTMEVTGLDAALGVDDIPDKMEYMVKGYRNPEEYFNLFRNSELVNKESHIWFRNHVVTMFDDHDQVRKGNYKARFCADKNADKVLLNVLALNVTTLGIPCIYYGSEQYFDGHGDSDRYLREAMFGGAFGAFRSKNRHFFNEGSLAYQELSKILKLRSQKMALRRGRQYLRPVSGDGYHFGIPTMVNQELRYMIAWARIFNQTEMVLAMNTDLYNASTAWVLLDKDIHQVGNRLTCLYSTDAGQVSSSVEVEARSDSGKAVRITVPPAGFVIFE